MSAHNITMYVMREISCLEIKTRDKKKILATFLLAFFSLLFALQLNRLREP